MKKTSSSKKVDKKVEIDVLSHELVPPHRILSEEEKKGILEKYGAKSSQLPQILEDDSVIKAMGAKVGDVIEIIREKGKYYRVVVQGKM